MASLFSDTPFLFRNLAAACRAVSGDTGSAIIVVVIAQQRIAVIKIFFILICYFVSKVEFECKISLSSRNNRLMVGKKRLKIGKSKYLFDFSSFLHTFLLWRK
jgi:hypothetical protein